MNKATLEAEDKHRHLTHLQDRYLEQVIDVLRLESTAIEQAAARLSSVAVNRAIELLLQCQGKVVVCGVGKSGIIARKIAATLTSTGQPATPLHPSDALHGGVGILQSPDVVMIVSNSGETDEIVALLPSIKRRGVPIIGIIGNPYSTLGRNSDVVLDASVEREACALNLAPTASTTVALAIGDALAIVLMQARNLTCEDFALNHPAGRLGKRLTLKVGDLMHGGSRNPVVASDAMLIEVVKVISAGGLGAVSVVSDDERQLLLGIITDGDVRRALQSGDFSRIGQLRSDELMTADPVTATPELLAYDALRLMEDRQSQISVLPIVDAEHRCIGLLRIHDIVRSGL